MVKALTLEGAPRKAGRPRDEAVRRKVVKAAFELMEEVGYARLSCDSIARRAGCGKATIYRWWPNKAAVVIDAFVESVTPELPNQKLGSLDEYVTMHLRRFGNVLAGRRGAFLAAVLAAAQDDADVEAAFLSHWLAPRRSVSMRILAEYQAEGELDANADLGQALDIMYGPLHFLLMVRHAKITPRYTDSLAALILRGLRAASHRKRRRPRS
ncbi:MAG: TetR/AcrR family transcriptional regulator [Bryobacterales bacterium]|nr:TetR/AcrR family transcriptional regulator [Bryobacterales bacterium]